MSRLEIALLGPPEIKIDNTSAQTDRRKAIALLAYLAVTGKPHTRDHLAGFLWPDYERDSAYAYLRRTLWELNQILGKGWIDADRERVALTQTPDLWLDTAAFQDLTHTGSSEVAVFNDAVILYRGDFLAGFTVTDTAPFEDWQFQQAEHFRRAFAHVLKSLVEIHLQTGEPEPALSSARRWLALDPLNEAAHRAIMRLLAGMGDRTGAIRQYETCVQSLQDELGIAPQPETTKLYEAVLHGNVRAASFDAWQKTPFAQDAPLDRTTPPRPVSHLPILPTPFIGRRTEVEAVKALVVNPIHRLITLIGPGGTGKTRLSLQAASEVEDMFPDGVFFTPLAPVQNPEAVLPAIAKALNFSFYQEEEKPRQQLLNFLRAKKLLLILDNFEHLIEAFDFVTDILTHSADVKLMVTSRVRLKVQGEQLFNVTGMRIPTVAEADVWEDLEEQARPFSAVQLFIDRARCIRRDFTLTKENLHAVMEICSLVHGMPLGLELAAAWLELLPPKEIVAEITRSLDFLETDQPDVPDRQRSIRAVFESSWKLLSEIERGAFLRLCVFVGSFSREAAQAVSGASLKTLLGLVNKSWFQQTEDGRFQLHELMRQYGEEELIKDKAAWHSAKNHHAECYANFVSEQSKRMMSPEQVAGLRALVDEYSGNVKAAWDWLVTERRWDVLIEKMALGLFRFGSIRWQLDILIPWFRAARLALMDDETHDGRLAFAIFGTLEVLSEEIHIIKDADPLGRASELWQIIEEHDLAEPMGFWFLMLAELMRARNLVTDVDVQLENITATLREQDAKWQLGFSALLANTWRDYNLDGERLREAENIFREIGVLYEQGFVAELLARHAFQSNEPLEVVMAHYDRARPFFQQMEGLTRSGAVLIHQVDVLLQMGEHDKAFALFHKERPELERRGNLVHLSANLHWEALHASRFSTFEHALQVRERSLTMAQEMGHQTDIAWRQFELAEIYRIFGEPRRALDLYEQSHARFENLNAPLGLGFHQRARGDLAIQAGQYSDALTYYQKYEAYALEDNHQWGIAQAQAKISLAHAFLENIEQARREMQGVLAEIQNWRQHDLVIQILLTELVCLIKEGKMEDAVELGSLLQHHHMSWNETKQQARTILEMASHELPDEVAQAAITRGKALKLETVVKQVLQA